MRSRSPDSAGKRGCSPKSNLMMIRNAFLTPCTNAVIALSGVAGLNTAEHLRSLCPACRIIWCSDLDFSLHAFRLRADYFLLKPVTDEAFRQGLRVWGE